MSVAATELDDSSHSADILLKQIITAEDLSRKTFPDLVQHIPGIISEGFGIIAGPPKLGKSWFTLSAALAVAAGGRAFGKLPVQQRDVLLLALEDSERRLQTRITQLIGPDRPPDKLHILTKVEPNLLTATITAWLEQHRTGLVILDTLGRARQQRRSTDDPYLADYKAGVALKEIVDAFPGSGLLGVHHTRKASSDDFVDDLSGTLGLAGSADYVLVLRRPRHSDKATLQLTSRDCPEGEFDFTVTAGNWAIVGDNLAQASEAAQLRRSEQKLSDRSIDVLNLVNTRAGKGEYTVAADVVTHLGNSLSQSQARMYLKRLVDGERIVKTKAGVYTSVTSVAVLRTVE